MKWIYTMVEDGSYQIFKLMYKIALKNNKKSFKFQKEEFNVTTAKHICVLADRAQKEYDEYIESMADSEYDGRYLEQ